MTSLGKSVFEGLRALRVLRLAENPLRCNCKLQWLGRWLRRNPRLAMFTHCDTPVLLHGKEVAEVEDSQFRCYSKHTLMLLLDNYSIIQYWMLVLSLKFAVLPVWRFFGTKITISIFFENLKISETFFIVFVKRIKLSALCNKKNYRNRTNGSEDIALWSKKNHRNFGTVKIFFRFVVKSRLDL